MSGADHISESDGIAASITIGVINYALLGFQFPVDAFYLHSFEIWLATTVVFFGSGNVGFTLLEYRLGEKDLVSHGSIFVSIPVFNSRCQGDISFDEPFLGAILVSRHLSPSEHWLISSLSFFFFGGLSIPLSQAILAHLFSYNMTWGATKKEVERSNFFKEVPKIMKRCGKLAFRTFRSHIMSRPPTSFWFSVLVSLLILGGMVVCATSLVPLEWRVDGSAWAVIFPLAYVILDPSKEIAAHLIRFSVVTGCHILFPVSSVLA
jgi:hypothetical protein